MITQEHPFRVRGGVRQGAPPLSDDELVIGRRAIAGMEHRLMGAEAIGGASADGTAIDTGVARDALMRHYAAYALKVITRLGGDPEGMRVLTNRDNEIPLARRAYDRARPD